MTEASPSSNAPVVETPPPVLPPVEAPKPAYNQNALLDRLERKFGTGAFDSAPAETAQSTLPESGAKLDATETSVQSEIPANSNDALLRRLYRLDGTKPLSTPEEEKAADARIAAEPASDTVVPMETVKGPDNVAVDQSAEYKGSGNMEIVKELGMGPEAEEKAKARNRKTIDICERSVSSIMSKLSPLEEEYRALARAGGDDKKLRELKNQIDEIEQGELFPVLRRQVDLFEEFPPEGNEETDLADYIQIELEKRESASRQRGMSVVEVPNSAEAGKARGVSWEFVMKATEERENVEKNHELDASILEINRLRNEVMDQWQVGAGQLIGRLRQMYTTDNVPESVIEKLGRLKANTLEADKIVTKSIEVSAVEKGKKGWTIDGKIDMMHALADELKALKMEGEAVKASIILDVQRSNIEKKAEEKGGKGLLEKVKEFGAWYNKQPFWKKALYGVGLLAVAKGASLVGGAIGTTMFGMSVAAGVVQRFAAATGMGVLAEAVTKKGLEKYSNLDEDRQRNVSNVVGGMAALAVAIGVPQMVASEIAEKIGQGASWLGEKFGDLTASHAEYGVQGARHAAAAVSGMGSQDLQNVFTKNIADGFTSAGTGATQEAVQSAATTGPTVDITGGLSVESASAGSVVSGPIDISGGGITGGGISGGAALENSAAEVASGAAADAANVARVEAGNVAVGETTAETVAELSKHTFEHTVTESGPDSTLWGMLRGDVAKYAQEHGMVAPTGKALENAVANLAQEVSKDPAQYGIHGDVGSITSLDHPQFAELFKGEHAGKIIEKATTRFGAAAAEAVADHAQGAATDTAGEVANNATNEATANAATGVATEQTASASADSVAPTGFEYNGGGAHDAAHGAVGGTVAETAKDAVTQPATFTSGSKMLGHLAGGKIEHFTQLPTEAANMAAEKKVEFLMNRDLGSIFDQKYSTGLLKWEDTTLWRDAKGLIVKDFAETRSLAPDSSPFNLLNSYIEGLKTASGAVFGKTETVEQFVKRAIALAVEKK